MAAGAATGGSAARALCRLSGLQLALDLQLACLLVGRTRGGFGLAPLALLRQLLLGLALPVLRLRLRLGRCHALVLRLPLSVARQGEVQAALALGQLQRQLLPAQHGQALALQRQHLLGAVVGKKLLAAKQLLGREVGLHALTLALHAGALHPDRRLKDLV